MAPDQSRDWALAMLRELDFIEGEWAAVFWALGSVTAIVRHAATTWRAWFTRTDFTRTNKEARMTNNGKKALAIAMGALCALMLAGCAFPMTRLIPNMFPGIKEAGWPHILVAMALPETIILVAAALLWHKRGPIAAGVLLTGLAIGLHLAVHLSMQR
jgi:hypothetical protein